MQITVSKEFSQHDRPADALIGYVTNLWSGYPSVVRTPQIVFNDRLTLLRLGDKDGYALFGERLQNPALTLVGMEASTLIIEAHSAADVEVGLMRFASNSQINALTLEFAPKPHLQLPACRLSLWKSRSLLVQGENMLSDQEFAALKIDPHLLR